jgi:superfamily I DNA/RNA helicase
MMNKLMKDKKFRRNDEAKKETLEDAKFVLEMDENDYITMRKTMSNDKGIRISTIHKTKGAEFRRVLLPSVDEKLKEESCLYYVAITRARDRLIYG